VPSRILGLEPVVLTAGCYGARWARSGLRAGVRIHVHMHVCVHIAEWFWLVRIEFMMGMM